MANEKPSTSDILAKIRAQQSGGTAKPAEESPETPAASEAAASDSPASEAATEAEAPAAQPETAAASESPKKPAAAPKGTTDIVAAIRAQGSGSAASVKKPAAKPATSGAAPKGTADILASIRGQGGAAAAAKPATGAAVAAKKAAPAKKKAAADAGDVSGLSAAELIRRARGSEADATKGVDGEVAAKAKPAGPALPSRPLPGKAAKPVVSKPAGEQSRRSALAVLVSVLLSPIVIGVTAAVIITLQWGLATARFMFPNVLVEPPTKFKIGPTTDYSPGTVSTKWKAEFGVWIVNEEYNGVQSIYALSTVCTHLGCTPNWLSGEQKFKCPCHGSGFYPNGINFEGPAPRPLERVGIRLAEDGMLEVDKSVKYQQELGQWEDASSFVPVA